jgi:hypothetical protein
MILAAEVYSAPVSKRAFPFSFCGTLARVSATTVVDDYNDRQYFIIPSECREGTTKENAIDFGPLSPCNKQKVP